MITAIVKIDCETGEVHNVAEELVKLDGVAEVYSVSGDSDIIAILRVKEYDSLAKLVSQDIGGIMGVITTNTSMAFRCYSKHDMERMWSDFL